MNIIITCGDCNGIGPEIAIKALQRVSISKSRNNYNLIIPKNVFNYYYNYLNCNFPFISEKKYSNTLVPIPSKVNEIGIRITFITNTKMKISKPSVSSGYTSLEALSAAKDILFSDPNSVLVTAPISKEAISLAGSTFSGHTEMIASWFKQQNFMMMFVSRIMKGGLLTIHEALRDVPKLLTAKMIKSKLSLIHSSLKHDFNMSNPKIALLGINPHSGENGIIGSEETKLFLPHIDGINYFGPFSADGFFAAKSYTKYDFTLSSYHDQLLIPFKMLAWKDGVNYTAGLPVVRTSPDHGTAYNIAGNGTADCSSLIAAIKLAQQIQMNRKHKI